MILAGDVGGTKVNLGLFEVDQGGTRLIESAGYPSRNFSGIADVIASFLDTTGTRPDHLCLGVAGPVEQNNCRLTNLAWDIQSDSLKRQFGFSKVLLVNDLAAAAGGIPYLTDADVLVLQAGHPKQAGRKAIVSAGTGLGEALLFRDESDRCVIVDTEGGHCGLPAYTREDFEILRHFQNSKSPVSIEHVLSGDGLKTLYCFYRDRDRGGQGGTCEAGSEISAEEVVSRGCRETEGPARQAVERFVSLLGGVAGDLALRSVAGGGVYLGGGIAPALSGLLKTSSFLESFNNRDKFQDWMKTIPVYLILNQQSPLWGAAGLSVGDRCVVARN